VVTSTKSGAAELVARHDAGFVCDARDVAALGGHLRALTDPALRARLGDNARNAMLPLSAEAMTLALVLLYKTLLEGVVARRKAAREPAPPPAPPPAVELEPPPDAAPARGPGEAAQ